MTYPVTVVIPTIDSRYKFLTERCLPAVKTADPAQILVVFGPGNGNEKRNQGAKAATQKFILFVDDDCEIRPECLRAMVEEIEKDDGVSFVYSDYTIKVADGLEWDQASGDMYPGAFNPDRLLKSNYINTTSLIRTSAFPGFDPKLKRFQDWDLWLTMAFSKGLRGSYINRNLFTLHQIDVGITSGVCATDALSALFTKHGI